MQLASVDLNACTKTQLRAYTRLAREEWGKPIDLRSANIHDLREYLSMYLAWKAEAENAQEVAKIAEVEDEPIAELKRPSGCNNLFQQTIDILLEHGTVHGDRLTTDWIQGILFDCSLRNISIDSPKEPLVRRNYIYYGLVGLGVGHIDGFKKMMSSPDEFGIGRSEKSKQGTDFYKKVKNIFGDEDMAQIAAYHAIRANFRYMQQVLGISSLSSRAYAYRDKLFSC